METGDPGAAPVSKRKLKSAARLKEYQQAKRLDKLRGMVLRVMKRMRFDRVWRVHNEWYAARASPAPVCDSCTGAATPSAMETGAAGATRAEPSAGQRSSAASITPFTPQDASGADFVPGLPWVDVEGAWHSTAVHWDAGLATAEPSGRRLRKARRSARPGSAARLSND